MIALIRKIFGEPEHISPGRQVPLPPEKSRSVLSCTLRWSIAEETIELSDDALTLLGFHPDSKPGYTDLKKICYPEDIEHIRQVLDSVFFKKSFPDFYTRVVTPQGEVKHLFIRGEVIQSTDMGLSHVQAVLQDVTEQRLHIQKIQQQNRKLQDIAWLQSHKMRSPVATIMGLIQLFNAEDPNDPINAKILEGVKEAANNLDEVIKEINAKTETVRMVS